MQNDADLGKINDPIQKKLSGSIKANPFACAHRSNRTMYRLALTIKRPISRLYQPVPIRRERFGRLNSANNGAHPNNAK